MATSSGFIAIPRILRVATPTIRCPRGVSDDVLVSLGGRFFGEQMAVDFGLVGVLGETDVVPFVGFVVNF